MNATVPSPPLRIAIDCSHYAIPGGIRTLIGNELRALAQVAPENDYILYFRGLARPRDLPPLPPRSRVVAVRLPRRLLERVERHLDWPPVERWTGRIDIFHGTHFALPAARAARLLLTVNDVTYLRHPEFYADRRLNDYGYRYLLGRSLRRADRILAISEATRRDLIELCGVEPERVWTILCGIDPDFRPVSQEAARDACARFGLDRPFALYPVGTMDVRKNLERTIRAFARAFPARGDRPLLAFTGVGDVAAAVPALLEELGLAGDCRVCRARYPEEVRALMGAAAWGMYLSLYEGFGLPALEGMACGLPLVVSNSSSLPEVVGDAALLADPREIDEIAGAMRRLQGDAALRADLSARGLARARSSAFSWGRAGRQLVAAYRDDPAAFREAANP